MKKTIIIFVYFLLFWIILPFALIKAANILDKNSFSGLTLPHCCRIIGLVIIIPAFLSMLLSVFQFRKYSKELPISAIPPDTIIQKGLFSVWRHPIYLFAVITVSALALTLQSYGFLFIVVPVFLFSVLIYIRFEEKALVKRFGSAYKQYRVRTALFVPKLQIWLKILAFPLFKIWFGIRISGKENIPASLPFFVIASHRNYLDPFFISYALPWPVRHISTFEMFRTRLKRKVFSVLGAIPKKRYASDTKSIILMKKALEQGYPIGVFPSGERSWTGITQSFKPGSIQMFKKFKDIPILPVRIEGNYYLWPRWSPRIFSAKVRITFEKVINVNDSIGNEKLEEMIIDRITPRSSSEKSLYCRTKNITGNLSRLLYRCPVCHEKETLFEIPPRKLKCGKCNNIIEIDQQFNLNYATDGKVLCRSIDDLYNDIKIRQDDLIQMKADELTNKESFLPEGHNVLYRETCTLYTEQDDAFIITGKGIIYLTDDDICFILDGIKNEFVIELYKVGAVTIESYYRLQLYLPVEKKLYQVILEKGSVIRLQDTIVLLMEKSGHKKPVTR
jgi:1-acyl-sn-glycerol-3-phosphate acyltransferase